MNPELSISRRTRATPFTSRVTDCGVKAYTVYNHMLLPTVFRSLEEDYWHLCEHVQVWDVSVERQVEITGPDAARLVQLMTPRDISKAQDKQCFYVPLCFENGGIVNDPIAIRHSPERWWLSIADSDIKLWAQGLATGFGLNVKVFEPDVWPLAVQGPKAEELVARLFGDEIRKIRFFRGEMVNFRGSEMYMARSGWSKQGGFEIYLNDASLGEVLWDDLFRLGKDLNVGPGSPNLIERMESGLLSYGSDIDQSINPFECGLDHFLNLGADIESLSLPALKNMAGKHKRQLMGLIFNENMSFNSSSITIEGQYVGEITSHCWSPRYGKHLAFAILNRDYLENNTSINVNGVSATISALPFHIDALSA